MSEEPETKREKHLSAKELLRNKGICLKAWNEWDESSRALPKIGGTKQFEPNGSWLEEKQIEKGLKSREFLLGIQRVERLSQLSSAEWLPEQKKARVTKKIGSEWANFGHEINTHLYLIPEEALILLETECLELLWNGVALSIQQAYEVLIESDGSDCSLDEYRVYSQLTRLGYRLQRYHYEKSLQERSSIVDESIQRKKVIVDPENGLWMAGSNTESLRTSRNRQSIEIDNDVKEIVENMVVTINGNVETEKTLPLETEDTMMEKSPERKSKNAKIEIISEQTILAPVKIMKDGISEPNVSKWPGARIQRNVKLMPKRNDKLTLSVASTENSSVSAVSSKHEVAERTLDKRKQPRSNLDSPEIKKSKHEVIELSDDEIEEIPRPMSRMEMLNYLPNIANQTFITENISQKYIPAGVKPRSTYRYDSRKLRRLYDNDVLLRTQNRPMRNGSQASADDNSTNQRNAIVPYNQQYPRFGAPIRHANSGYNYNYTRPFWQNYNQYSANSMVLNMPGGMCMQQISIGRGGNWQNSNDRWSSYQMNLFRNTAVMGFAMRSVFTQNVFQMNIQHQMMINQQYYNRSHRQLIQRCGSNSWQTQQSQTTRTNDSHAPGPSRVQQDQDQQDQDQHHERSCTKFPGATSWAELKQKWREAKTITIEDEESSEYEDTNEIQFVEQTVKPLVNARNTRNFTEIYERLRIIKSAPHKTVRRKKSDLKISYNVYSSTQHYRKSNPGLPMFHLVVTSRKDSLFLQPVELNRLQQDGRGASIIFAHVSNSTIAYIQPGIITLPNLM